MIRVCTSRSARRSAALFAVAVALAACEEPTSPSEPDLVASSAPSVPPAASSEPAPPEAHRGEQAAMPGPNRGRTLDAVRREAECRHCHPREAEEHRTSLHRRAALDPAYRAAAAIEPLPFCEGCHAPESTLGALAPPAVREMGVGCVTCHVAGRGEILAAARDGAPEGVDTPPSSPHEVRRSSQFARTGGCAGCHEFPFPRASHPGGDGDFMQTTVREHARSRGADRGCADCHMPVVEGRRSHSFSQVRDPEWLRARLRVSASRPEDGVVRVTLVQTDPGHAFPTGDLFRRLAVGCEVRSAAGEVIARDVRYPRRHFDLPGGGSGRALTADDRVFDAPLDVDLDLSEAEEKVAPGGGATARFWVTYQRVAQAGTGLHPEQATIESEIRLQEGQLSW